MNKDVLVTISGTQIQCMDAEGNEYEDIEIVSPATYFYKDGLHYIFYEEVYEGISGVTKNKIILKEDEFLEITKKGVTNSVIRFDYTENQFTEYETPFGNMQAGITLHNLSNVIDEEKIDILVKYELAIDFESFAECTVAVKICNKSQGIL